MTSESSAMRASNGPSCGARDRARRADRRVGARLRRVAAVPGEGALLARPSSTNSAAEMSSSSSVSLKFAVRSCRRRIGRTSPRSALRTAAGKSARSVGLKSPASRMSSRSIGAHRAARLERPSPSRPGRAAGCARGGARGRRRRRAGRPLIPRQRAGAAELAQRGADAAEGRAVEDVGARRAARRSRARAPRRWPGTWRRRPRRPWCRTRCRRARACCSPRPAGSPRCPRRSRRSGRRRATGRWPWRTRAAVDCPEQRSSPDEPVPRWSKTSRSRVASAGAMFSASFDGERDRRLARAAGEPDHGRVGRVARRDAALDVQRQRAAGGARGVERHRELPALEPGGRARRERDRGVRGGSRDGAGGEQGDQSGEDVRSAHRPPTVARAGLSGSARGLHDRRAGLAGGSTSVRCFPLLRKGRRTCPTAKP